ncbi:MAG TPA: 2'-5' RNA ligase family protein, partial [Vicinamibacterales bacterium]|nr:2'-5' RNA ligase family protein [Vicinamibacterales bacterium]
MHLELALSSVRGPAPAPGSARGPLRWTEPGDRHLTLAFYGDVPEGYVDEVSHALDEIARTTAPFRLALRGAGVFDGRTVWIGCSGDVDALQSLMGGAAAAGGDVLARDPDHRSRAHLTVARVRPRDRRGGRRPGGRHAGRARPGEPPAAWPAGGAHPMG